MGRVDEDRKLREANYAANLKAGKVQEPLASTSNSVAVVRPLSKYEAGVITSRINSAAVDLCTLVLEAHDRLAYKALGYSSWESYAAKEFSFGRSRSYQLLTQGQVQATIQKAVTAGLEDSQPYSPNKSMSTIGGHFAPATVDVSEREARDIKPILDDVVAQVRDRVASGEDPAAVVPDVIKKTRQKRQPKPKDSPIPLNHPGYEGADIEAMNDARFGATKPTPPPDPGPGPSTTVDATPTSTPEEWLEATTGIPVELQRAIAHHPDDSPKTTQCPHCGTRFVPDPC